MAFLPLEPSSSKGDIAFLQNLLNVVYGKAMVTDGVWDDELQKVLDDNHVVDSPGDTSIGGNEFFRNVFRPYVQAVAGGDHPHPFASLTHTHPVSVSLGTVQAETGAPK